MIEGFLGPATGRGPSMQTRQLGHRIVGAIGLGGMQMSIEGRPDDRSQSIATIHAALDAGITLIDTADAYHIGADEVGHNETLIAEALSTYGSDTSDVVVATKGGHLRPGAGRDPDSRRVPPGDDRGLCQGSRPGAHCRRGVPARRELTAFRPCTAENRRTDGAVARLDGSGDQAGHHPHGRPRAV